MNGKGLSGLGQKTAWADASSLSLSLKVSLNAYPMEMAKSTFNLFPGHSSFPVGF